MLSNSQQNVVHNLKAGGVTFGVGSPITVAAAQPANQASRRSVTLIVVGADVEREAVFGQFRGDTDEPVKRQFLSHHTVYDLGTFGASRILLAQVGPGTETPDSAGHAAAELIDKLRPDHLVLTGICYGLREEGKD